MEIKNTKKISSYYNKEKEEFPIQIKEIKTLYQCNTLKNFNKGKDIQKIIDNNEEKEINNKIKTPIRQINELDNGKINKNPLSLRHSMNNKDINSLDKNIPLKNIFDNNLIKKNINNLSNNNPVKKFEDKNIILYSGIKENEEFNLNNIKYDKIANFNNIINNNIMNNLNDIVIENKKKIKQNQGKLNKLINLIKTKEVDGYKRYSEEFDNYEINNDNNENKTQVFRYVKKIPQKNSEVSSPNKLGKNYNIKDLKRSKMKKQNTSTNNNVIINVTNQIYKKSLNYNEEKYNNYILNKDDNKKMNNKNNIYPNRIFSNPKILKNNENVNNMRVSISLNEKKENKDKKENIYVNKIKENNFINNKANNIENNNDSFKYVKNNNTNNINLINKDTNDSNKNKLNSQNKDKINSPQRIYIPKKPATFRGISQENSHNDKRKNMSPANIKKIDIDKNKYSNNNTNNENDNFFNYFNSEKRINNKEKNYDYDYYNNNGRATYNRKYSKQKQNYNWQNNSSYYSKNKNDNNQEKEKININEENFFNENEIFDNEINDISSIKINSSYDSYTMDYENNINRIKIPIVVNDNNNQTEKKNNLVYIKYKNNGGNLYMQNNNNINHFNIKNELDNNNNIKKKKYSGSVVKNQNNSKKICVLLNKNDKIDEKDFFVKKSSIKQNLRYTNSDKKFSEKYIENFGYHNNPNCISSTNFFYFKNKINNDDILNKNNINCKSQKNYFNINKKEEKINKKNNLINKIFKNELQSFKLDDLVVLDEQFKDILSSIEKTKSIYNACFDFLNYFKNNCDIFNNLNLFIKKENDFNIIKIGIYYILMSVILLYDYSYKPNLLNQIILFLKEMMNFNYQNLILIYEYLIENTLLSEIKNIWELKLIQIISNLKSDEVNNSNFDNLILNNENNNRNNNLQKIKNNTSFIFQTIKIIIKNYKNKNSNILFYFFKELHKKQSLKEIFNFYENKILHSNGLFGYMSPQLVLKQRHGSFIQINPPYIKSISKKKYTLILGLEETLINFKFKNSNINGISGVLRFRPGLNSFLTEMKKYFEIIVFSLYPQKIGNYLIDTLEKKEKFIDYRFFVQHSIIIDNEFVKDLKRIGRPMDRMIIVDNLPQNFKLNKKNGIKIKSYWEEDYNDSALGELSQILIKIVQEGGDVRKGLEKHRDDIIGKVSSKIDL